VSSFKRNNVPAGSTKKMQALGCCGGHPEKNRLKKM